MPRTPKALRLVIALLGALCLFLLAPRANATHFRYGNITYTVVDPISAPTTVRFEVTMAWRSTFIDGSSLSFGDNTTNAYTTGFQIGTGTDAAGLQYAVMQYSVTHTYPAQSQYVASFTSCCRLSNLINAGDASFLVQAKVDLTQPNIGNPVAAVPAIIQLQTGGVRTINIGATDPDGTPINCRFATTAESSIPTNPPIQGAKTATIAASTVPPGCIITWDTTGGVAGNQFATQVVLESIKQNGIVNSAVLDFIIEFVSSPPPKCTGSGNFVVDQGQAFQTIITGTVNAGVGGNLVMNNIGLLGSVQPAPGTTAASPFNVTFNSIAGSPGSYVQTIVYTDQLNSSGFCNITMSVPSCPEFGTPCTAGVGQCQKTGYEVCNQGAVVCNAVAGQPAVEVCNGLDEDCDGVADNGNPGAGSVCQTGIPGICSTGVSDCPLGAGAAQCIPDFQPGQVLETCNGVDDNCDGQIDEGFGSGQTCTVGIGACQTTGLVICDGMGGTACSAVAGNQTPEICDNVDNDCNGSVDDGLNLGDDCTSGVGLCQTTGVLVCDGAGGVTCSAVAGQPSIEQCGNNTDEDCDGTLDNGCTDSDNDGLYDTVEIQIGTKIADADSDDDGLIDGQEAGYNLDVDNDGLINALDPDSDNDGLRDGTEMGKDCSHPDTTVHFMHCVPDADPSTTTDPLSADSDGGGVRDGSEDSNLNGAVDAGEGDPKAMGDDGSVADGDGDGLSDALEIFLRANPADKDSDDDGVLDGDEANPSDDTDRDGLVNVRDADSDNDALFDGTEVGNTCDDPATDSAKKACKFDGDPGTTTSSLLWDSDGGGKSDGSEDSNLNGVVGQNDGDPNDPSDDASIADSDGDGLSDLLELTLGSVSSDKDTDDDGALDGMEANPSQNVDSDEQNSLLDPDSDDDGLPDGLELGQGCSDPATKMDAGLCIPDGDNGATRTCPLDPDTDGGSKPDGAEDANKNGVVEASETDPNAAADDVPPPECLTDADCGGATSGKICENAVCAEGCRGTGNGCPEGSTCDSTTEAAGICVPVDTVPPDTTPTKTEDDSCGCRAAGADNESSSVALAALAALGLVVARRRRRNV